jgi:CxxC-x17-CxxC domain-containing protein
MSRVSNERDETGARFGVGKFSDQTLTCVECEGEFTWTAGEQKFFREKGFTETPKRRKPCREARRSRGAARPPAQAAPEVGPREEFQITCAGCGQEATVPFKPTRGKPVFCHTCFKTRKSAGF